MFILASVLISGMLIYFIAPILQLFVLNERQALLPYLLPLTDIETAWGYILNYVNHAVIAYFACLSGIGNECTFAMMINSLWAGVDIVRHSIEELKECVKTDERAARRKDIIREILVEIQDLDRFIIQWKEMFFVKFLYTPIAIPISLSVALLCILIVSNAHTHIFYDS